MWSASAVVAEGMEIGLVASYWASSDTRSAGRTGVWGGAGAANYFTESTPRSRMSAVVDNVEGLVKTRDTVMQYLWRWLVNLET